MKIPRGKTNETLVGVTFLCDEVNILLREIVQTACKIKIAQDSYCFFL